MPKALTRLLHRLRSRTPAIDEEGFICGNVFENDYFFSKGGQVANSRGLTVNVNPPDSREYQGGGAGGGPTRGAPQSPSTYTPTSHYLVFQNGPDEKKSTQITADDGGDGRGETERGRLGREDVPISRREGAPISRPMCRPVV